MDRKKYMYLKIHISLPSHFSFFSLLVTYIIVGALYNKFARNREGKDVFPHYTFWIELPVLVKVSLL